MIISIPKRLLMRRAANSGGVHLEWPGIGGNTYSYPPSLNKEKFVHLVYTWGNGNVTLYGNGQFVRSVGMNQPPYFPASFKELPRWTKGLQFYLSDPAMTQDGKNKTCLDELMLFNRPLDAVEVKSLYRHLTAPIQSPVLRIGSTEKPPVVDGNVQSNEWNQTAQVVDFVDTLFGNLVSMPVKANVTYDRNYLYVAVRSPVKQGGSSGSGAVEIRLVPKEKGVPYRFLVTDAGGRTAYSGSETPDTNLAWQAAATAGPKGTAEPCFECAIPWKSIGLDNPPDGTSFKLNIVRRESDKYGDACSWADITPVSTFTEGAGYGTIVLGGKSPVLTMDSFGNLNFGQLNLAGRVLDGSNSLRTLKVTARLQPSDLKEYYDPKTMPGTKSYTGTLLNLDRDLEVKGGDAGWRLSQNFSETDINCIMLEIADASGGVMYKAMRTFITQPPLTVTAKTYPSQDKLEVKVDISSCKGTPREELRATVELMGPSGKKLKSAAVEKFTSTVEIVRFPLAPLRAGSITVKGSLFRNDGTKISEFTTSFKKVKPGPWFNTKAGKDDIVIPPFTPVEVKGQSVSVCGRTYRWDNSLFPVQITSDGKDLLAGPMELLGSEVAAGKPNPARVRVVEHKKTRAIIECAGEIGGVPVTAEHVIEYDGMCLTRLCLTPRAKTRLEKLSLLIPYRTEESTLYYIDGALAFRGLAGAVREKVNYLSPPMNGKMTHRFVSTVWLGNEDRGMTWFAEDAAGWKLKGNPAPLSIEATDAGTMFKVQFAGNPFEIEAPLSLTFGLIATPVKPMCKDWRFFRFGREFLYVWNGGAFTEANNDIANPEPYFMYGMARARLYNPRFYNQKGLPDHPISFVVPYQFREYINIKQPESSYYGEEWMLPPYSICGEDSGGTERHLRVCLGSAWQDFFTYYAVKAFNDLGMDGYYFDGGVEICDNTLHGHGWYDEDGKLQPTFGILGSREFLKRIAVELYKSGRPSLIFCNINGGVQMPVYSFIDMGWNGEQFSRQADPARDYNKLITLSYFRVHFLGQQFGIMVQWLGMFNNPSLGTKEIDTMLELALVHGVGDLMRASSLGNWRSNVPYVLSVLNAQDGFGIRKKDCVFLPYWKNIQQVTVEPNDENLVCSIWQRPGKVLLVLANSTQKDQDTNIRLNLAALGLENKPKAFDLISKEAQPIEAGVIKANVAKSGWRLIVVENNVLTPAREDPVEALFDAVKSGALAKIEELFKSDPNLVGAKDFEGYTPLHLAVYYNRKEVVKYLLAGGANVNAKCRFGFTPLHMAAEGASKEITELLLARGADVNASENHGIKPLHFAVNPGIGDEFVPAGYMDTVRLLLDKGADVNAKDNFGRTPLHWLAYGHPSRTNRAMAELLLEKGADVNAQDIQGRTPLWFASTPQWFKDQTRKDLTDVFLKHGGKE